MRKTAWALVATAPLLACAGLNEFARSTFQEPRLTFRSASLEALDLEGATVAFRFDVDNPNSIGVDLARVAWGIEVEGTRIVTGELPGGLKIPAMGTGPVSFPVRVRYRDVPGIVSLLSAGRDDVRYRLFGAVGIRTPLGVLDLPLSHEDALKLPSLPRFALDGVAVRSVSLTQIAIDVRVRVRNSNAFAMPAGRIDYALALGGTQVARAAGAVLSPVAGSASAVVEIPVSIDLLSAGRAAADLVRGGDVDVGLAGTADVAGIPLPLDLRARVPARK
jgi:LEA14-like dessication related protein